MPLQDLTPQLRTRLNRMERAVGWFVMLATLLLIGGFGYYMYKSAEKKGWFADKARYYTYTTTAAGLKEGGEVSLLGRTVGHITEVTPMPPRFEDGNIYVEFVIINQSFEASGYLWTRGTVVKFVDNGFVGERKLDLTKGTEGGYGTYISFPVKELTLAEARAESQTNSNLRLAQELREGTNVICRAWRGVSTNLDEAARLGYTNLFVLDSKMKQKHLVAMWNEGANHYEPITAKSKYGLASDETPALGDRLNTIVGQLQAALPNVYALTNQIGGVLSNASRIIANVSDITTAIKPAITNLADISASAKPIVTNFAIISANLTNPNGSLGQWVLPTNINQKLDTTLTTANGAVGSLNTNLLTLNHTLDNLGNITSNLNQQVQVNTNLVSNISKIIVDTDDFIQGLKRFWLFRHTFASPKPPKKAKTSQAPVAAIPSTNESLNAGPPMSR